MIVSTQESNKSEFFYTEETVMPKHISAIALVLILILGFTSLVKAATPRSTWVQNEIYQYNHPFASQLPQELATKMQKMTTFPYLETISFC
ncbi:MAG: hypothetical protein V7K97_28160 [Nostoc sp.]|uniref:hypothetical protein n=1 Tax=Nostoc sp. TaxID=1180 RepID=UPI002FFBC9F2